MKLGKRFFGLLLTAAAVTAGFFFGPVEAFPSFSTAMGMLYVAYLGGQSATDWKHGGGSSAPAIGVTNG